LGAGGGWAVDRVTAPSPVALEVAAEAAVTRPVDGSFVGYDVDGNVVLKNPERDRILQLVDNPMGFTAPEASAGVVVEHKGEERWVLLQQRTATYDNGNPVSTGESTLSIEVSDPRLRLPTFQMWLDDLVRLKKGLPRLQLVEFKGDVLVGIDGATVVDQRPARLSSPSADDMERTTVAEVSWRGEKWFVVGFTYLGEWSDLDPSYSVVSAEVVPNPTLAGFVDYGRWLYSEDPSAEKPE
ncbi:MAG: hypothetical protein ACRCYU_19420, partial [Nocardioides sp.]